MSAQFSRYIWVSDSEELKQEKRGLARVLKDYDAGSVEIESVVSYISNLSPNFKDFNGYLMLGRAKLLGGIPLDDNFARAMLDCIKSEMQSFTTNEWEDALNILIVGLGGDHEYIGELFSLKPSLVSYLIRRAIKGCGREAIQESSDITGVIYYSNPLSGFFSMVENILLADFVAKINRKKLCLLQIPGWPLPVPLEEIVKALGISAEVVEAAPVEDFIYGITNIRDFFYKNSNPDIIELLLSHKSLGYGNLRKYVAEKYLHALPAGVSTDNGSLLYVRRGDKIELEDIPLSFSDLEGFIGTEIFRKSAIFLISDDYHWAEGFSNHSSYNVRNITFHVSGGSVGFSPDEENFRALLSNFYYLSEFQYSYGTSTSNLVNAAFIYRYKAGLQIQRPTPSFITPFYSHI